MVERFVRWLLALLGREVFEIGRLGDTYLTRWTLLGRRLVGGGKLFLHLFHRGDAEPYPHDHPWGFWSLILAGGYWEVTADGKRKWYGPGRLLRRPADWQHRVELPQGRKCWTLVWTGPKVRGWGFICRKRGWIPWREHERNQAAGLPGCGEE
jgi:hypothetical protein